MLCVCSVYVVCMLYVCCVYVVCMLCVCCVHVVCMLFVVKQNKKKKMWVILPELNIFLYIIVS